MSTLTLGNKGTYTNGVTHYGFTPYRGADVSSDYQRVDVPGVGQGVWARIDDRGEDEEKRTLRDEDGQVIVYLSRYAVCVLGWGSDTIGGELVLNAGDDLSKSDFEQIEGALCN